MVPQCNPLFHVIIFMSGNLPVYTKLKKSSDYTYIARCFSLISDKLIKEMVWA